MTNNSSKRTTIIDIASHLGISHTTVSRALNGSPKVKEPTRRKIVEAAHQLGYVPNQNARGLNQGRTYTIGLFFTDLQNGTSGLFLTSIILNIREQLPENYVLSINSINDHDRLSFFDGVVVVSQSVKDEEFINNLVQMKIPVVVLNRKTQIQPVYNYWLDNYSAAREMTTHALQAGHRNVALIRGSLDYASTQERSQGYFAAIQEWDAAHPTKLFAHPPIEGEYTAKGGCRAMEELLARPNFPDYVFIENDDMAIGALHAINAHPNLKHPVSVSGFDDMDIATYTSPSLTTVHSPITEMTALGIATLKHLLTNDELDDDIPFKKCFKMPIIYRESLRK